jgi:peptidoglycan/xylan/chitin deacetylase (PgdA/CDA1 family)
MGGKEWKVLAVLVAMVVTMVPFAVGSSAKSIDAGSEEANAMATPEQQFMWSFKPVKVNTPVNLEREGDKEYIQEMLNKIESHGWITSVFVTGVFASGHPEVVREIEGRGHYIGVYGWQDEDLSLLGYTKQLSLINKSIAAVRSAVSNPQYVVDFKPQNLKYNDDTIKALQDLQMNSITATFSANETFVQCPYAKSVGKVTFPYPITTDFAAVPVSDVKIGSEVVLLTDREVFSKLAPHECLRYLKDEFDAHNETKDPMVGSM